MPGHFLYKYWLVAFAAMRHRRQKWRVGFDEQAFQWHFLGSIADRLRFGKCQVAGERDHEAQIKGAFRVWPGACEAVQNSSQSAGFPMSFQKSEAILPGVVAARGWPAVHYDRQFGRSRQLHLS